MVENLIFTIIFIIFLVWDCDLFPHFAVSCYLGAKHYFLQEDIFDNLKEIGWNDIQNLN